MGKAESQSKFGEATGLSTLEETLTTIEANLQELKSKIDDIEQKIDDVKTDGSIRVQTV